MKNGLRMAIDTKHAEEDRNDEWTVRTSVHQMVEHCGYVLITRLFTVGWGAVKLKGTDSRIKSGINRLAGRVRITC